MHYVANTVHLAGKRAGEPIRFENVVYFGNSPVSHKIKSDKFRKFLIERLTQGDAGSYYLPKESGEFLVQGIDHVNRPGTNYDFCPHYTFVGFGETWYDCPFDSLKVAEEWAEALNSGVSRFVSIPTAYSQGKKRELDSARRAAVWPDATDEQLSVDRDELKKALEARLPALLDAFKSDIESIGFKWLSE
jgi:hypothetical protein